MLRRVLLVLALAASVPSRVVAQRTSVLVVGVADAVTGKPLDSAEVVLPEFRRTVKTDWLGEARLKYVPAGRHAVRVRHVGYAPAEVDILFGADTVGATFMLTPTPKIVDTVRITAAPIPPRLREFETRRELGIGRFLTEEQLAREGTRDFESVAETRFPGLRIVYDKEGKRHIASTRGGCGASSSGGGPVSPSSCFSATACPVKIYLDDIDVGVDDDLIRTWDLVGAEFYTGASMPPRYRISGSACGVLLLWSKV